MTKILLVEDDKSLREIYGVRLLAEGYDIISAGDGEEALAMAIKERPALIVSDVMMPKISGFDMLDILRSTTETKNTKVIMMTALSSDDQRTRGEQLGADRYLVKSQVGIEDVVRTVHEVLEDAPTTSSPTPAAAEPQPAVTAPPTPEPTTPQSTTPTPSAPAPEPTAPSDSALPPATPPVPAAEPVAAPVVLPTPAAAPAEPVEPTPASTPAPAAPIVPTIDSVPESTLPRPTAPFSTERPEKGGNRVIEPINNPEEDNSQAFMDQMAKELEAHDASAAEPSPAPSLNESSLPPAAPATSAAMPVIAPQPTTAPAAPPIAPIQPIVPPAPTPVPGTPPVAPLPPIEPPLSTPPTAPQQ